MEYKWNLKDTLYRCRLSLGIKGIGLMPLDVVVYAGMYLTGRVLEWFKPYLIEYQTNKLTTTNLEIKYIFIN